MLTREHRLHSIHADKTANYNEYSVGVFLKHFFEQ
jgi:hypothetical protein